MKETRQCTPWGTCTTTNDQRCFPRRKTADIESTGLSSANDDTIVAIYCFLSAQSTSSSQGLVQR